MQKKSYLNSLESIPEKTSVAWEGDGNGNVTLKLKNEGVLNKILQLLLKKPQISYIHLDEMGSFVWKQIDGKATINVIGKNVKENFGEKAEPLYERLIKYINILEEYKFIKIKKHRL